MFFVYFLEWSVDSLYLSQYSKSEPDYFFTILNKSEFNTRFFLYVSATLLKFFDDSRVIWIYDFGL